MLPTLLVVVPGGGFNTSVTYDGTETPPTDLFLSLALYGGPLRFSPLPRYLLFLLARLSVRCRDVKGFLSQHTFSIQQVGIVTHQSVHTLCCVPWIYIVHTVFNGICDIPAGENDR